jgi:hypothetical protein
MKFSYEAKLRQKILCEKDTTGWICAESAVLSDQFPKCSTRLLF